MQLEAAHGIGAMGPLFTPHTSLSTRSAPTDFPNIPSPHKEIPKTQRPPLHHHAQRKGSLTQPCNDNGSGFSLQAVGSTAAEMVTCARRSCLPDSLSKDPSGS